MKRAFTLIELLIVIALFSILLAIAVPITIRFYQVYQITTISEQTLNMVRSAQEKAKSGLGTHGVHADITAITLYRGPSFASRNTAFDERVEIPSSITITGVLDFQFMAPSGTPNPTGTLTLQNPYRTEIISVNSQGLIEKQY